MDQTGGSGICRFRWLPRLEQGDDAQPHRGRNCIPAAVDQVEITRGGENAIAATVPCGLTSQSSLWDYIYGDQFTDEEEYNEKVLPIRLKLDVYYVKHASFWWDIKLIIWTVIAIFYTLLGRYPQWMHDKLVEYAESDKV